MNIVKQILIGTCTLYVGLAVVKMYNYKREINYHLFWKVFMKVKSLIFEIKKIFFILGDTMQLEIQGATLRSCKDFDICFLVYL